VGGDGGDGVGGCGCAGVMGWGLGKGGMGEGVACVLFSTGGLQGWSVRWLWISAGRER